MYHHLYYYSANPTLLNVQQQDQDGYPKQIQTLQQSWAWKVIENREKLCDITAEMKEQFLCDRIVYFFQVKSSLG